MAVPKQTLLLLLACVCLTSATFFKAPPPAENGCYKGRYDGSINVQAVFDSGGVTGYVQFYQPARGQPVEVNVNLRGLEQFAGSYPWHVHDYPVRDALLKDFPCTVAEIGRHYDPLNARGNPNHPENCNQQNPTNCEVGDLEGKLGRIRNDQQEQYFVDENLDLYGPFSVVGRALAIHYPEAPNNRFICANIEPAGCRVKTLRAAFKNSELEGEIVIRHTASQDSAKIFVDLYRVDGILDGSKMWTLHFGRAPADGTCDGVRDEIAGESPLHDFPDCSPTEHRLCPFGDLTTKCGPLQFVNGRARLCCTDTQLGTIPFHSLFSPRTNHFVSVLVRDIVAAPATAEPDGCARFDKVLPQRAKAKFNTKNLFGTVIFYQNSPLDRTFIQPTISGIRRRNIQLTIHQNPVLDKKNCSAEALGPIISKSSGPNNMFRPPIFGRPPGSTKTGDSVLLGNLAPKVPIAPGSQRLVDRSSTHYLPLFGPHSIIGGSVVVVESIPDGGSVNIACGNIVRQTDYPGGLFASFTGYQETDNF